VCERSLKAFVILHHDGWEFNEVEGIFTTKTRAENFLQRFIIKNFPQLSYEYVRDYYRIVGKTLRGASN
jgi:hypothetical protein